MSAVLRKLQLSNRHELSRWAVERRLSTSLSRGRVQRRVVEPVFLAEPRDALGVGLEPVAAGERDLILSGSKPCAAISSAISSK